MVEAVEFEAEDRTIVVAMGGARLPELVRHAIDLARVQGRTTGIPYRQVVVFHTSKTLRSEQVYEVTRDSLRPAGVQDELGRMHTELTALAPDDLTLYLALVPNLHEGLDELHAAMEALVVFHERNGFKAHIVMIGEHGITAREVEQLQARIEGSTLVSV